MTKLVQQSNQIMSALKAMISGLNAVENELSNPRSGLIGALNATEREFNDFTKTAQQMTNAVSNQFQNLAQSAHKWMQPDPGRRAMAWGSAQQDPAAREPDRVRRDGHEHGEHQGESPEGLARRHW